MRLTGALAGVLMLGCAADAAAFECGEHFAAAEEAIDKVVNDMKGMAMMDMAEMKASRHLLEHARKMLAEAKKDHANAKTAGEHALAIGKAEAAIGYATAADIYHWKVMRK